MDSWSPGRLVDSLVRSLVGAEPRLAAEPRSTVEPRLAAEPRSTVEPRLAAEPR